MQWWTTDADVEALCSRFGRVADVRFKEDRATGRSLGVVEVVFAEPEAAAAFKRAADGCAAPLGPVRCLLCLAAQRGSVLRELRPQLPRQLRRCAGRGRGLQAAAAAAAGG
jgi:hypothetical protein